MRTSARGLAFLSQEEGCVLVPYNDSAGHATIGVGHLLHHGPVTDADRVRWRGFTRSQAIRLLKKDVRSREAAISRLVDVGLNQNEYDALLSLIFNIGEGAFEGSTVRRRLNAGDRRGAADAFLMWRIGGAGLIHRRRRERAMFLTAAEEPLGYMTPTERRWCQEYDRLKARNEDRPRRVSLRAAMKRQRQRIWRLAQPESKGGDGNGWDHAHRQERYRELLRRSS